MNNNYEEELKLVKQDLNDEVILKNELDNEIAILTKNMNSQLAEKKIRLKEVNKRISNKQCEIAKIKRKLKDIDISDHAILRYIERVIGLDMDDLKDRILSDYNRNLAKELGNNCTIKTKTHDAIIKDGVVVTVITS